MWFFFLNKNDYCGNYLLKSIISLHSDDFSQDLGDPIVNLLLVILKEREVLFISPCLCLLCLPLSSRSIPLLGLYKHYPGTDFHQEQIFMASKGIERLTDLKHTHSPSVLVSPMSRLWKVHHPHPPYRIGRHSLKLNFRKQFNTGEKLDSAQQWRTIFWKLNVTVPNTLGPYWRLFYAFIR